MNCTLSAGSMKTAAVWMARYEKFWAERLDALGRYLVSPKGAYAMAGPSNEKPSPSPRIFPVAPEKVWQAWTDPQALKHWFGPDEGKVSFAQTDVRVGGRFHVIYLQHPQWRAARCQRRVSRSATATQAGVHLGVEEHA